MRSPARASAVGCLDPQGARPSAAGCPFVSPAVAYGDAEPLPEPLLLAILAAWKQRQEA